MADTKFAQAGDKKVRFFALRLKNSFSRFGRKRKVEVVRVVGVTKKRQQA